MTITGQPDAGLGPLSVGTAQCVHLVLFWTPPFALCSAEWSTHSAPLALVRGWSHGGRTIVLELLCVDVPPAGDAPCETCVGVGEAPPPLLLVLAAAMARENVKLSDSSLLKLPLPPPPPLLLLNSSTIDDATDRSRPRATPAPAARRAAYVAASGGATS